MIIFDSIKNHGLNEAIKDFKQLRKEYESEVTKLGKKYRRGVVPEEERKVLEDAVFSKENFHKILPEDRIISIKGDITTQMAVGEITLYNLNEAVLRRLGSDYRVYFLYTGKCTPCNSEIEQKIPVDGPVTDAKFIDNDIYRDAFSDYLKCNRCGVLTYPVKTANLFVLEGENDYDVKLTSARKKSEGRIVSKFVQKCSGKQKDIRDIHGLKLVCKTEEQCKEIPELMLKYHSDDRIKCRDYFEVKEMKNRSGITEPANVRYFFYLDKKGRPKKAYLDEPLEMKIRHGFDAKGRPIKDLYRAIHMPIDFKGTLMDVQAKDLLQYQKENDPKSPLYHGSYAKRRPHYEEKKEMEMRSEWSEFEQRLEKFLYETKLFSSFNLQLYSR
jgi:hypothetical protein